MTQKTCAACDYPLDANAISVTIGGKTVEVCCDACAVALKEAHAASVGAQSRAATRLSSIVLAGILLLLPAAGALAAAEPIRIADAGQVQPPTLMSAKQAVTRWLADSGERQLRAGSAAFDGNGNISVEVVNVQGVPVRHFVVDGRTRSIAVAQAARRGGHLAE
jgi:hypothetical protein